MRPDLWIFRRLPQRHREIARFLMVGGASYVVDTVIYFALVHAVLPRNPLTAGGISALVATIISYILNSEWTFHFRGGRVRQHEAALFFLMNGIALAITLAPLAVSRYLLGFTPTNHSVTVVNIADFVSRFIVGVGLGMVFRFWSYKRFVFPVELAQNEQRPRLL